MSSLNFSSSTADDILSVSQSVTTQAELVNSFSSFSPYSNEMSFAATFPSRSEWTQTMSDVFTTVNDTNRTLSPEECDARVQEFRDVNMLYFDHARKVRVLITWSVFLLSAVGNCFVLTSVTIKRRRRAISHSQLMMMHLTIANLAFTVFILPVDAIWQTTLEWFGGDFLCRLTNVLKQFAMYSSSAMVVVMGIDRVANLMCPMSLPGQRRRIRIMLAIAWIFCLVNAIPAGVIFNVMIIPVCGNYSIVQCVDLAVQKKAKLGAYYVYTMFVSFFGPLICILVCYILIAVSISKMAKLSKEAQKRCLKRGSSKSVTKRGLDRARRVSLIVTGLITATFILCWGPYYVTGLIEWFGKNGVLEEENPMSRTARDVMLMSMYLNPMLHPIITIWLMKEIRDNILMQCKRSGRRSRRNPRRNAGGIAKMDNNGVKQLMPKNNDTPQTRREWL